MPISQIVPKNASAREESGAVHPTRELFRERWCDEDGNVFTIVVWRSSSKVSRTFYTLDDGTPVQFKSHSVFRVVTTGELLFPCED